MIDLERRRKYKKYFFSKLTIGVFIILVVILSKATWNAYQKKEFTRDNLLNSTSELEKLQDRSRDLKEKNETLSTPEGVEDEIRRRFPVAKEGEKVIILVEDKNNIASSSLEEEGKGGLWYNILKWLH